MPELFAHDENISPSCGAAGKWGMAMLLELIPSFASIRAAGAFRARYGWVCLCFFFVFCLHGLSEEAKFYDANLPAHSI